MSQYEVTIFRSGEEQVFVAEAHELPGFKAHGSTCEKALAAAEEAMTLWLETAREFGDAAPAPKKRRVRVV